MKVNELLRCLENVDMTVKTQKRRRPIPKVFVLYPDRVKIALTTKYVDCLHYVSRSGLTFNGCAEITDSYPYLKIVYGIYYVPTLPIIRVSSRRKMSRNEGYFLSYVKDFLLSNKELTMPQLVVYDNYGFRTYDKFIKGGIRVFPLFDEMDGVKIYKIPDIDPNGFGWIETRQIEKPVPISMVDYYGTHVLGVIKGSVTVYKPIGSVTVYKPILSERGNTVINTLFVNISSDTMISIRRRDGIVIKEMYIEPGWYIFEEVNNESK